MRLFGWLVALIVILGLVALFCAPSGCASLNKLATATTQEIAATTQPGTTANSVATGAVSGGEAGAPFGPWGVLVGFVGGGVVGYIVKKNTSAAATTNSVASEVASLAPEAEALVPSAAAEIKVAGAVAQAVANATTPAAVAKT